MGKLLAITILLSACLFNSCNYKLLVNKSDVIYNKTGYLIYFENTVFFTQNKSQLSSARNILDNAENSCFALNDISEQQLFAFQAISSKLTVSKGDMFEPGITYFDTLYYVFVRIKAKPRETTFQKHKNNPNSSRFEYQEQEFALPYNYFWYDLYYLFPEDETIKQNYISKLYEFMKNN